MNIPQQLMLGQSSTENYIMNSQWNIGRNGCSYPTMPASFNVTSQIPQTSYSNITRDAAIVDNASRLSSTLQIVPAVPISNMCSQQSIKRKQDENMETPPSKMLITEEKMAAKMRGMHISSDYTNFDISNPQDEEIDEDTSKQATSRIMNAENGNRNGYQQLYVSDEVKRSMQFEDIVPRRLIEKSPMSTALVIWKPLSAQSNDENMDFNETKRSSVVITELSDDALLDAAMVESPIPLPYIQNPNSDNSDAMEM